MSEIDLPCVLSIQTGINEPRYVGHARHSPGGFDSRFQRSDASDLGIDSNAVGERGCQGEAAPDYFVPAVGQGRRDADGRTRRDHSTRLIELMKAKGGYQQ